MSLGSGKKRSKGFDIKNCDMETQAWLRGYDWAMYSGNYKEIRDCRIVAMAYAMGWMNGRKRGQAVRKVRR